MGNEQYQRFCLLLEKRSGILLGTDKRYLVETRLSRVLRDRKIESIDVLMGRLLNGREPALTRAVIEAMTTNETLWFRDEYPFAALRDVFFPGAVAQKKQNLRIWSAACSTGQESYSISILVSEIKPPFTVEIIGTDLSSRVVEQANSGLFDELSLGRGLSAARKNQFFDDVDHGWRITPEVRHRVRFQVGNLLDPPAGIGRFDIVFCRNVLIYFSRETKAHIIEQIANSLQPHGVLILGASESTQQLSDRFKVERLPSGGMAFRLKS